MHTFTIARRPAIVLGIALGLCLGPLALPAADWPQWRGPQRNGISAETGLLKEWPKEGPTLVWQVKDIGTGYSTPAMVGDRLYLLSNQGLDNEFVQALEAKDGKRIWSQRIGKVGNPDQQPSYPAARSTPTGPTMPMTGGGQIPSPSVSLYRLTLPPVMGVSKKRQASDMPSMASTSWPMISGRSGFPKFRQLVAATGWAPTVERFRQHSATASMAPSRGER